MYKKNIPTKTTMKINNSYVAETIEAKVRRITTNKEPITDGAPLIYTERNQGVQPGYNIKTDRFEIAVEAMDTVSKTYIAKREERHKPKKDDIGGQAKEGMKKEGEA
ncbi:MAG: hypothetical protein [Microviridae sp.]|nr:MAG: hypothetical protein [Microviridae sp.]